MAITMRQAINAKTLYELTGETDGAGFTEIITQVQLKAMGADTALARVRAILLCDDGYLFPSAGVEVLAAEGAAGDQAVVKEVDDPSVFEAGRAVRLRNAAGQEEERVILSIVVSDTDILTLTFTEDLINIYVEDDDCMDIPCLHARIPMYRGVPLNEDGLYWKGIAIQRRLDQDVTVEGYAVVF